MSLTLALAFPAQTVEHWVGTYLQAAAIAQVSTPGQKEPCPGLPCEPQGPGACGPCLTQATALSPPPASYLGQCGTAEKHGSGESDQLGFKSQLSPLAHSI